MRSITNQHLQAYKNGCLQKLFNVIKEDPELSFEIRMNNEVMIYYHKDKILTISFEGKPLISMLSEKYYKGSMPPSVSFSGGALGDTLKHTDRLRKYFTEAKQLVRACKSGMEFEVQQNIALGNHSFDNRFVVVDMEWQFSQSDIKKEERISKTRIDLIIVDTVQNNKGENDIYLAELKVGTGAMEGKSGIIDHVSKTNELITNATACAALREDVQNILKQKQELGLLEGTPPELNLSETPRMMIILAYRGEKEKKMLEKQAELAEDKARELGMEAPLRLMHNVLITLQETD